MHAKVMRPGTHIWALFFLIHFLTMGSRFFFIIGPLLSFFFFSFSFFFFFFLFLFPCTGALDTPLKLAFYLACWNYFFVDSHIFREYKIRTCMLRRLDSMIMVLG
ncbi:hypothetical protein GLOIN_2v1645179 [Rhizophagus irregularis DAOM 181602=DAOM 197198]|uniref:Uncharacterized protein n=1 Tax=Rhizophagus irregularis (strain DAOM 181602 / DAOM 197198 / MUCL 43194) TaxID=747089 RepID=A0A2P4PQK3_RHIID|nr:hypothetical protein GLOIN_2v1645179 [Rhizophagus irregularis DAOM 181602=DAOM 197198]POG67666.1 hypothetical protein GLOIN_2v1645179 [Rhizophagus irregularis DAOM 181602=DAOM 197198]|eukprot:XP_025174532.1 hypothetical protein GLOIN_2v1645179 [Rhizophagus irregularis DAOM 181602=DAOM 197198]